VIGDRIHQLDDISFAQELLAEIVQTLHLPPPAVRRIGFHADACGKLASDNRGRQKRPKRHPVLRVGNRKRPDGWQKIKVKQKHGADRHDDRHDDAPHSGNC